MLKLKITNDSEREVNMSNTAVKDTEYLKTTSDLLETDPNLKSYIYQQLAEFNAYITPETMVYVLARDPHEKSSNTVEDDLDTEQYNKKIYKNRIVIILQEGDGTLEAEAFHDDIYEAIKMAKEALIQQLLEIQEQIESPQDRLRAIREASENRQIH